MENSVIEGAGEGHPRKQNRQRISLLRNDGDCNGRTEYSQPKRSSRDLHEIEKKNSSTRENR